MSGLIDWESCQTRNGRVCHRDDARRCASPRVCGSGQSRRRSHTPRVLLNASREQGSVNASVRDAVPVHES